MTTVGFAIFVNSAWLGGVNYYRNLITALYEDPERRIDVVLLTGSNPDPAHFKGFPELPMIQSAMLDWRRDFGILGRIWERLTRRNRKLDQLMRSHGIDVLSHSFVLGEDARTRVISWIPDFQHVYLPALFSAREIQERNHKFEAQCSMSDIVVLSSEAARADLIRMFPWASGKSEVLRFVPRIEGLERLRSRDDLERQYEFSGPYIYLPNQYWAHKNHGVVVEALALLRQSGRKVQIISTGNQSDYRHPDFYEKFCAKLQQLGVGESYLRLGIVPYADLLALMRHAVCLINPSLFEGWSTTVEEGKAMGKHIILSDLPVHREQNPERSDFFATGDAQSLAEIMWKRWQKLAGKGDPTPPDVLEQQNQAGRLAFSRRYHEIVDRVMQP